MDDIVPKHTPSQPLPVPNGYVVQCKCGQQSAVQRSKGRATAWHKRHAVAVLDLDVASAFAYYRGQYND